MNILLLVLIIIYMNTYIKRFNIYLLNKFSIDMQALD